ncbi:guanine nucleotide-binding protein subunit gamma 3-like isoform X2 [Glycine soja]|uniref:guanine nucleotide-binding protein subunit gamma 3-like isoform X2 n=1 Tax=Glycine soja TaxID=3848 RepID=UPI00103E6C63|nr:guanine nucleotide-binding protein subunit gamma 3-like isoform X2 [Glycine soja]
MDGGGYNLTTTSLSSSMEQVMRPKSPLPGLVDFHGKRKQMVKIQVLEREIGLLQEELKSLEGLNPASRCCKELDAFVDSVSDPFTPTKQTVSKSHHFRRQMISLPRVCCSNSCLLHKKTAKGCCWDCCSSSNSKCCHCCGCCCCCLKSASRSCAQNCC